MTLSNAVATGTGFDTVLLPFAASKGKPAGMPGVTSSGFSELLQTDLLALFAQPAPQPKSSPITGLFGFPVFKRDNPSSAPDSNKHESTDKQDHHINLTPFSLPAVFITTPSIASASTPITASKNASPASVGLLSTSVQKNQGAPTDVLSTGVQKKQGAPAASLAHGQLAFEMRVLDRDAAQSKSAFTVPGTQISAEVTAEPEFQEKSHDHDRGEEFQTIFAESMPARTENTPGQPAFAEVATTVASPADNQPLAHTNTEPLRSVHMQLVADDNRRVDVRLVDRGGELHVSVRSADINLAQNMQDHMPELTSRLEQQRFQAEVWMPNLHENSRAETTATRDFSSSANGASQQEFADGQRKRQNRYQPDWLDVLENSSSTGVKNQYTWLQ